jgi:murein DD-endopeptidase MepM/ murein hydrolase activator NlpD
MAVGTVAHAAQAQAAPATVPAATPAATAATPAPQAAAAPATPAVLPIAEATAAAAAAEAELRGATAAKTAAEAAAAATDLNVRRTAAARAVASAALQRTSATAERDSRHLEAAQESEEVARTNGMQPIDPATAVAAGIEFADLIDPSLDPMEQVAKVSRNAESARARQSMDRVALADASTRYRIAETAAETALAEQLAAAEAVTATTDRLEAATVAQAAAAETLAVSQEAERAAQVERERRAAAEAAARAEAERRALEARRMQRPSSAGINSPFGMRSHPVTGVYKLHSGTDFGVGDGKAHAARAGTVTGAGYEGAYGNMVTISHGTIGGDQIETRYAHLASINVSVGATVSAGQSVGQIGTTGSSTGPHLHFEVLVNGDFDDPMTWLGS